MLLNEGRRKGILERNLIPILTCELSAVTLLGAGDLTLLNLYYGILLSFSDLRVDWIYDIQACEEVLHLRTVGCLMIGKEMSIYSTGKVRKRSKCKILAHTTSFISLYIHSYGANCSSLVLNERPVVIPFLGIAHLLSETTDTNRRFY